MKSGKDPTQRFSKRAENYARYRPGYPDGVIETLKNECGLTAQSAIADIGSGTGILSAMFLSNGNRVFGIEPNREMRETGEKALAAFPRFVSIDGTAEATMLPDLTIDFVTAAQAFHWFDRVRSREEFVRILNDPGWVVLLWNNRRLRATPFLASFEALLQKYGTDYKEVNHTLLDDNAVAAFFGTHVEKRTFPHVQEFDLPGLKGRVLSCSYVPEEETPGYLAMMKELEEMFGKFQVGGKIEIAYKTVMYFGRLPA